MQVVADPLLEVQPFRRTEPPGRRHVARPRLTRLLDAGADRRLTLVAAPAGYGKTTLLADWAAGRRTAWVTVDARRRDAESLAGELDDALAERPDALVVDDCHLLSGEAGAVLHAVVADAPPRLQVVVAGRTAAPFPIGTWRAGGWVLELGAADLRLTELEALLVVRAQLGRDLPPEQVAPLVAFAEGWPAALALAVGAFARGAEDAEAHLRELVLEEILGDRPDALRFLLRTSVLDRLEPRLCDAVLRRRDSRSVLRALVRDQLLVLPEPDGESFRLHEAVRRILLAELRGGDSSAARIGSARAQTWLAAHGRDREALAYAAAAGDAHGAARLAARLASHEDPRLLLATLERLPPQDLDADLRALLVRAWLLAVAGRRPEADAALELAARRVGSEPRLGRFVERERALLAAALPWDEAVDCADDAPRPLAAWARGSSAWWRGHLDEAERQLEGAAAGPPLVAAAARAVLSRIACERHETDRADELAAAARATAEEHGLAELPLLGLVATARGAALAIRGDHEAALPLLEQGIRLRRLWGGPLDTVDALVAAAPTIAVVAGRAAAADALAEARRVLATCVDPGVLPLRLEQAERLALPRSGCRARGAALSRRELTVLRLLAAGRSKREIGDELYVSFNTVHTHTKAIYRKLGVSSRSQAVVRGRDLGVA